MPLRVVDRPRPHGGIVRTVTIARPERRNALDANHLTELGSVLRSVGNDATVRVVVIAGEGKAFCAGYDLNDPLSAIDGKAPDSLVLETMALVRDCPVPSVARVHGAAFGAGLHLAIACDLRVATADASFCLPPAKLGIAYAPEGLSRLVALVGTSRARRMVFTGEVLKAETAAEFGLIDELVSSDDLDARITGLTDALSDTAPLAVRAMKESFNRLEAKFDPDERARAEAARLACYASADAAEGVQAFAEKRPPVFRGR